MMISFLVPKQAHTFTLGAPRRGYDTRMFVCLAGLLVIAGCGSSNPSALTRARVDTAQQQLATSANPTTSDAAVSDTAESTATDRIRASAITTSKLGVQVAVSPQGILLGPTESSTFTAKVTLTGAPIGAAAGINNNVLWSISPAVGTIDAQGRYTAPDNPGKVTSVTITAVSAANPARSASGTVALQPQPSTLRNLSAVHGLLFGTAVDSSEFNQPSLLNDPTYAGLLKQQYSMIEGENAMKWMVIGANQGVYNFGPGDDIVTFAQANGMKVRGHNLCWNATNPGWLSSLSSTALSSALHDYIFATMGHYKGKVFAWDVVNEAISDSATGVGTTLKDSIWYNLPGIGQSGTGYIKQAFQWARAADPTAKLFYNDYGIEVTGNKSQALLNMIKDFKATGVPIDGVGLQMHVDTTTYYPSTFPATLKAYTDLGVEVHITEMDVRIPVDSNGNSTAADLQAQANTYSFVLNACLANVRCTAFQTWGFTDAHSWIPSSIPGFGNGLPFDMNYQPKAAVQSMVDDMEQVN